VTEAVPAVVEPVAEAPVQTAVPVVAALADETPVAPAVEAPVAFSPGELIERVVERVEPPAAVVAAAPPAPVALPEGMVLVETRGTSGATASSDEPPVRRGRPRPAAAAAPAAAEPMRQVETRH